MHNRLESEKSPEASVTIVQSVVPAASIRMKSSTTNWLISREFAEMAPQVPRPMPLRSSLLQPSPLRPPPLRSLIPRSPVPQSLGVRPLEPRPLGLRSLGSRPLEPFLPIAPPTVDKFSGKMPKLSLHGYIPSLIDEKPFRRRRQLLHTRTAIPTWNQSGIDMHSMLSNVNNHQSAQKIVSVNYTDTTGGSMVVTRRRGDGKLDVRVVYSREFIVAASGSPLALLPPPNFRHMVLNMMEIVAKFPKSYYNTVSQNYTSSSSK